MTDHYWRVAIRKGALHVRPFIPGEHLTMGYRQQVSVSPADLKRPTLDGGMIGRNPKDHTDQWYIAPEYFREHYVIPSTRVCMHTGQYSAWCASTEKQKIEANICHDCGNTYDIVITPNKPTLKSVK